MSPLYVIDAPPELLRAAVLLGIKDPEQRARIEQGMIESRARNACRPAELAVTVFGIRRVFELERVEFEVQWPRWAWRLWCVKHRLPGVEVRIDGRSC